MSFFIVFFNTFTDSSAYENRKIIPNKLYYIISVKYEDFHIYLRKFLSILLIDLEITRPEGNWRKVIAKYANPLVLILDKQLLQKPTGIEQKDIFELLHRRRKKSSTIFYSQYGFKEWYDQLGVMPAHW